MCESNKALVNNAEGTDVGDQVVYGKALDGLELGREPGYVKWVLGAAVLTPFIVLLVHEAYATTLLILLLTGLTFVGLGLPALKAYREHKRAVSYVARETDPDWVRAVLEVADRMSVKVETIRLVPAAGTIADMGYESRVMTVHSSMLADLTDDEFRFVVADVLSLQETIYRQVVGFFVFGLPLAAGILVMVSCLFFGRTHPLVAILAGACVASAGFIWYESHHSGHVKALRCYPNLDVARSACRKMYFVSHWRREGVEKFLRPLERAAVKLRKKGVAITECEESV